MKSKEIEYDEPLEPGKEKEIPADGNQVTSRVKIKAPGQKDGKGVRFTVKRDAVLEEMDPTDKFKPGRVVITSIILHKETEIEPPVELRIEILDKDVERAKGQPFKLAYTQGRNWVVWPEEFPSQAGFVTVTLAKREDPAIGMSP